MKSQKRKRNYNLHEMSESIKLFPAIPSQLFDNESLSQYEASPETVLESNTKLMKRCKKTILWKGKYHIAIHEFKENQRQFRIATPLNIKNKIRKSQFSFGAWDTDTGEIYLFFNGGKEKAKSRHHALTVYHGLVKTLAEEHPTLLPFAIKL